MSSTTSSNQTSYSPVMGTERIGPWQERLQEHCHIHGLNAPIYSIASDRRGGRTAWSCTVDVQGQTIPARYWYDGQYVHNAKEDAACVALERLRAVAQVHAAHQSQQQQGQQVGGQVWGYGPR